MMAWGATLGWAGFGLLLKKVQAIKDRWAACMQVVHKVKTLNEQSFGTQRRW
jgi:hypothetical protein